MKFFSYLYDKTIFWSGHRHARYYLAGVSFIESCFFPIPPDVMLISMGLAAPNRSWYYAFIATLFSVAGGIVGYFIGMYGILLVEPYIISSSFSSHYYHLRGWLDNSGLGVVILAGFTPIPYKIFTITAGAMHISFWKFIVGSLIGRGTRFFMVSGVLFYAGQGLEKHLRRYIDLVGCVMLLVVIIAGCLYKWVL